MGDHEVDAENYAVTFPLGPRGEWTVQMQWPNRVTQGGPAVLIIHPSDADSDNESPAGGITQTLLREVDFKDALDALREGIGSSERRRQTSDDNQRRVTELLKEHAALGVITDVYMALLARAYVGAVNQGQAKPLEYLATLTDKSEAAIKNHLWRATRKGFLERTPGRAGGRVTDKAASTLIPVLNAARKDEGLPPIDIGESPSEMLSRLSEETGGLRGSDVSSAESSET